MVGGKEMSIEDIIGILEKNRPYFQKKGGLTISGGEPLLQRAALIPLFQEAKKHGFQTALDTNGSILDEFSKKLLEVTDLVLLDIKHSNRELHTKLTGVPNDIPLQFARYCEDHNHTMWLRYVLVPEYTDQPEYLHEWAKRFTGYSSVERVEILPYHRLGEYKYAQLKIPYRLTEVQTPTTEKINEAVDIFKQYFKQVYVR